MLAVLTTLILNLDNPNYGLGPVSRKPRKPTLTVRSWKTKMILTFETLHKCNLCRNAKPVDIENSQHERLHGFCNGFSGPWFLSQVRPVKRNCLLTHLMLYNGCDSWMRMLHVGQWLTRPICLTKQLLQTKRARTIQSYSNTQWLTNQKQSTRKSSFNIFDCWVVVLARGKRSGWFGNQDVTRKQ